MKVLAFASDRLRLKFQVLDKSKIQKDYQQRRFENEFDRHNKEVQMNYTLKRIYLKKSVPFTVDVEVLLQW